MIGVNFTASVGRDAERGECVVSIDWAVSMKMEGI